MLLGCHSEGVQGNPLDRRHFLDRVLGKVGTNELGLRQDAVSRLSAMTPAQINGVDPSAPPPTDIEGMLDRMEGVFGTCRVPRAQGSGDLDDDATDKQARLPTRSEPDQ